MGELPENCEGLVSGTECPTELASAYQPRVQLLGGEPCEERLQHDTDAPRQRLCDYR